MICNDDEDIAGIFIEPPDAAILSDEDSADEDEGGIIDNLTGSQLRSNAEIVFGDGHRISASNDGNDDDEEDSIPLLEESPREPQPKRRKKNAEKLTWEKADTVNSESLFPETDYSMYRGLNPVDLFELIFDDEVLTLIIEESTRYALYLNCPDPKITSEEIRVFIGVLIISGYSVVPGKRLYWESSSDVRNELVYNSMRRERFVQIMRFLHFSDNAKPVLNDKMWKLRPLINLLKQRFQSLFRPTKQMDYDESMVAYYGRHGCKQFIRGKPIRYS